LYVQLVCKSLQQVVSSSVDMFMLKLMFRKMMAIVEEVPTRERNRAFYQIVKAEVLVNSDTAIEVADQMEGMERIRAYCHMAIKRTSQREQMFSQAKRIEDEIHKIKPRSVCDSMFCKYYYHLASEQMKTNIEEAINSTLLMDLNLREKTALMIIKIQAKIDPNQALATANRLYKDGPLTYETLDKALLIIFKERLTQDSTDPDSMLIDLKTLRSKILALCLIGKKFTSTNSDLAESYFNRALSSAIQQESRLISKVIRAHTKAFPQKIDKIYSNVADIAVSAELRDDYSTSLKIREELALAKACTHPSRAIDESFHATSMDGGAKIIYKAFRTQLRENSEEALKTASRIPGKRMNVPLYLEPNFRDKAFSKAALDRVTKTDLKDAIEIAHNIKDSNIKIRTFCKMAFEYAKAKQEFSTILLGEAIKEVKKLQTPLDQIHALSKISRSLVYSKNAVYQQLNPSA
jgi:hypothetical protein